MWLFTILSWGNTSFDDIRLKITFCLVGNKVCSPDGDTDYFDIVAEVLQGDTLVPYLFIICLDYVFRTLIKSKKMALSWGGKKEREKEREEKRFFFKNKKKKQKVPCKNNYWRHSDSGKNHPPKLKHYCIVWNKLPQALASMSMHTKRNACALIKQATFPH